MDHGIDWWGDATPPEELNHIEKGKNYGWPYFFADSQMNPRLVPPGGLLRSEWKAKSVPMVMGYTPHAAPMQMSFYTGTQFPASYRDDPFVSFHGSWNRKPSSGYEVVRIRFNNGQPTGFEPFLTGFLTAKGEVRNRNKRGAVRVEGGARVGIGGETAVGGGPSPGPSPTWQDVNWGWRGPLSAVRADGAFPTVSGLFRGGRGDLPVLESAYASAASGGTP